MAEKVKVSEEAVKERAEILLANGGFGRDIHECREVARTELEGQAAASKSEK